MKTREKILYGLLVFILVMVIAYTIIFIVCGDYPKEIFMALVPVLLTEFIAIAKLGVEDKRHKDE